MHLIFMKGQVESRDLVGVQILVEVQTLLEFGDVIPRDLPTGLPSIHNIQYRIDLIPSA